MSNTIVNEVEINGVVYVAKGDSQSLAKDLDGIPYVIIRTYSAGCFAGYLKGRDGKEVQLVNARRLWYWDGAASLSQLAIDGVSKPQNCKFAVPCDLTLTEAIEVITATEKAQKSISEVKEWIA